MDGSIDVRLVLTVGGIIFSVAGAAAVARSQISRLQEMLRDVESRLRTGDTRTDQLENSLSTQVNRLDVIAKMMSPENMENKARETATMLSRLEHLESIHPSNHPNGDK
jgi:flagellar capping protein FliD